MARAVALAVLLLAVCGSAFAARTPLSMRLSSASSSNFDAMKWLDRRSKEKDMPVYVAFKYTVPPSLQDDFVDRWEKFEKDFTKTRGLEYYVLSKAVDDNTHFWSYAEWDCYKSMMDHFDCKYTQDFHDFIADKDIMLEMFPLESITENTKMEDRSARSVGGDLSRRGRRDRWDEEDPRDLPAHVLMQFHVPPSERDTFEDTILDTAERVYDEKENRHFSLRKVATMNHHYIACGSWDSMEGYFDHITSKHFRKLRAYTAESDIEWYATCMRGLASSEKGERA